MRLFGRRMIFSNSQDFRESFSILGLGQFPEGAFSLVIKQDKGEFAFDILDDEAYVLIKMSV
jgi:hypothetical protein